MSSEKTSSHGAFTVDEFCESYALSRTRLYEFWKLGNGPRYFFNGTRRIISATAAADWIREREAEAAITEK